jgi:invasion protein IalB
MEDNLIDQMKKGQSATFIVFQTPEEGIGIPVSLNGFGPGFDSLP